jgi:hypothetical protein
MDAVMDGIWRAAREGDRDEVERIMGQDPGLLHARDRFQDRTPLMWASQEGHVGVVRWLLDKGAAINERDKTGFTALWLACRDGRPPVVRLLLERDADPTIASNGDKTPLTAASRYDRLEVVRMLLGHASAKININHRDDGGRTALWYACHAGRGGVVRALLENGADPTIAKNDGTTPMAIARQDPEASCKGWAEGRRECVAALEVSLRLHIFIFIPNHLLSLTTLAEACVFVVMFLMVAGGGAGLYAVEGPTGGRPAGERRGGGAGGAGGLGGEEDEGAGGLRASRAEGGPGSGPDGVHGVRGGEEVCVTSRGGQEGVMPSLESAVGGCQEGGARGGLGRE